MGEIHEENVSTKDFKANEKLIELADKEFSGYVVVTIEGVAGIEEGVLLYKKGALTGTFYEYLKHGSEVFGSEAIGEAFNAFAAPKGVVDVFALSSHQVDLVTAFYEKIKVSPALGKKDVSKRIVSKFSTSFAEKVLKKTGKKESKYDVFRRLGLGGLG